MRTPLGILFCLLLLLCPAAADENKPAPRPLTREQAAEVVLDAVKAGDDDALKAQAESDHPDPWLVAEELCSRGAFDAADAFAGASPRAAVARLPAYLSARRKRGPEASTHKLWQAADAAFQREDAAGVLALTDSLGEEWPSVAHIRIALLRATTLLEHKRHAEAFVLLDQAAEAAEGFGWLVHAAATRLLTARHYYQLGDAPNALDRLERALAHYQAVGDQVRAVGIALNVGLMHSALGDHAKALRVLTRALRYARVVGNQQWIANTTANIGNAHFALGNYTDALANYRQTLRINEELGNQVGVARQLSSIGQVYLQFGEYTKALAHQEQARARLANTNDETALAHALRFLGNLHLRLGNFAKALSCHEQALEIAVRTENQRTIAYTLLGLGNSYMRLGDTERARSYYERSLKRHTAIQDKTGIGSTLVNLGRACMELGAFDEALAYLEKAQRVVNALGDRSTQGHVLGHMAAVHALRDEYAEACALKERALVLFEEIGQRASLAETRGSLGVLRVEMGEREEGMKLLGRAVRTARHIHERGVLVWCLWNMARLHLEGGEPERALARAREARTEIEHVVSGLDEEQGAVARGRHRGLFEIGVASAAEVGDIAEAVGFLEGGRAGALMESLNGRQSMLWTQVPEGLRREEARARVALERARERGRNARVTGKLKAIREAAKRLDEAASQVRDVAARMQREVKGRAAGLLYPRAAPLEDIQARLTDGEALILYSMPLWDEARAIVLTRRTERIVSLGPGERVSDACAQLTIDPQQDPRPALDALRKLLVAPLLLDKAVTRVLVSPEGPLCYLPISALFDQSVAFTPSGTTHVHLLTEPRVRGKGVLALGDPNYDGHAEGGGAVYVRGRKLLALPSTRPEAVAVGDEVLLGAEANETRLRAALAKQERWRAVHFACHGIVDPERPTLSALALSKAEGADGFLTALDVLTMDIPADLAVLSACETGKGKIIQGEGIVGLTRAFMFAGSPRVICSLWKVDDQATQALMIKFYELWNPSTEQGAPEAVEGSERKGLGAAAALKKAQVFIKGHDKWKHPYYWAAWVLWGLPE